MQGSYYSNTILEFAHNELRDAPELLLNKILDYLERKSMRSPQPLIQNRDSVHCDCVSDGRT